MSEQTENKRRKLDNNDKQIKNNFNVVFDFVNNKGTITLNGKNIIKDKKLKIYEQKHKNRKGEDIHYYYFTQLIYNIIDTDLVKHKIIFEWKIHDEDKLKPQQVLMIEKLQLNVKNMFNYNYDDEFKSKTNIIMEWNVDNFESLKCSCGALCEHKEQIEDKKISQYIHTSTEWEYDKFIKENIVNVQVKTNENGNWSNDKEKEKYFQNCNVYY